MEEESGYTARQNYIWFGALVILFAVAVFMLIRMIQLNSEISDYHRTNSLLVERVDSLVNQLGHLPPPKSQRLLLSAYDIQQMKEKGLTNPVQDLITDLRMHPELIPYESVLGGEMRFFKDEIYVLTSKWVLAYFEDGHIAGKILLEYSVDENGAISWQVIQAMRG